MTDIENLLELVKDVARSACRKLCELHEKEVKSFEFSSELPREMKADADRLIEKEILSRLKPIGLPILSEEAGELTGNSSDGLRFIIDPLDGTVNFIRGLGKASVSIALYRNDVPIFGVLGIYPTKELAWGGAEFGAFLDGKPIQVSAVSRIDQSVLCTGFPSRFQFDDAGKFARFTQGFTHFSKVRMLGSAAISLLKVAEGAAELYLEKNIMLWDVAAGLAILEGAGGQIISLPGSSDNVLNIEASNGKIKFPQ